MSRVTPISAYLTTSEVGELLGGASAESVRRWTKQGRLPKPVRTLGGHLRYERAAITAIAEQLQTVRRGDIAEVLQRIIDDAGGIEACDEATIEYVQMVARQVGISK